MVYVQMCQYIWGIAVMDKLRLFTPNHYEPYRQLYNQSWCLCGCPRPIIYSWPHPNPEPGGVTVLRTGGVVARGTRGKSGEYQHMQTLISCLVNKLIFND